MQNRIEWGDEEPQYTQEGGGYSSDSLMDIGEPEIWTKIDKVFNREDGTLICPVCRLTIEDEDTTVHVCSTCHTKYHHDCWTNTLNRKCSFHN